MRRGGHGKEASDQSEPVKVTPLSPVLHWIPRTCIGVALTGGGIAGMFLWDWRYVAAGLMVALCGLIVGPWVPPKSVFYEPLNTTTLEQGDDEVHL